MTSTLDGPAVERAVEPDVVMHGTRRRVLVLCIALAVLVSGLVVAARLRADGDLRPLTVTRPGRNVSIEQAALTLLKARDAGRDTASRVRQLHARPRVVGLVHPRRNVVIAGIADEVVLDGRPYSVYTVITLLNRSAAGYQVDATATTCDGIGAGIVFAVPVPGGDDAVIALGISEQRRLPSGSHVVISAGHMSAWTDSRIRVDQIEPLHGGEPLPWQPCP